MSGLASTVPGAIGTLAGYMANVAASLPALNIGVYGWGMPTAAVANNLIALGSIDTGVAHSPIEYEWAAMPASGRLRGEHYTLEGTVRTAGGGTGQGAAQARMQEAWQILNALHQQIVSDPGGSGMLSPSGSWGRFTATHRASGPQGQSGWVVTYGFELEVINALLLG